MDLQKIEKVIELARKHGIYELSVEEAGQKISVKTTPPAPAQMSLGPSAPLLQPSVFNAGFPPSPQASQPFGAGASVGDNAGGFAKSDTKVDGTKVQGSGRVLRSPFVGTFYRAPAPGADVFCDIGKRVKKGDTLCIIEAMKLMNEIESEFDGVIKEILVDNEQPVEFDQPLFVVE